MVNRKSARRLLALCLIGTVSAIATMQTASAAGDQLWREQVAVNPISLDPSRMTNTGSSDLIWREQVDVAQRTSYVVRATEQRIDTRNLFWREQVKGP